MASREGVRHAPGRHAFATAPIVGIKQDAFPPMAGCTRPIPWIFHQIYIGLTFLPVLLRVSVRPGLSSRIGALPRLFARFVGLSLLLRGPGARGPVSLSLGVRPSPPFTPLFFGVPPLPVSPRDPNPLIF